MKKRAKYGILFIGAIALLAVSCSDSPDAASTATGSETAERAAGLGPVAVETVVADRERLVGDIEASGLIRGSHEATVISQTQGVIEEVGFTLGEAVETGALLVRLDDSIQALSVAEARETLASAELDLAATDRLVASGNASQVQLARARSAVAGARARLAQAEKAQADRTIEAPIPGSIASVEPTVQVGNQIGVGSLVARIVDTSELEVVVALGEREVRYVAPGSVAYVTVPSVSEREIRGTVQAIAAGSDPATGSFSVVVRWMNATGLRTRSGFSAAVRIPPTGSPRAIVVPANAIQSEGGESFVYTVGPDGTARRTVIERGDRLGDRIVVASGISAGDQVIVSGLGSVAHGTPVAATPRLASSAGAGE